jgi:hypothetical protein
MSLMPKHRSMRHAGPIHSGRAAAPLRLARMLRRPNQFMLHRCQVSSVLHGGRTKQWVGRGLDVLPSGALHQTRRKQLACEFLGVRP